MKKILILLVVLLVCLTGCGSSSHQATQDSRAMDSAGSAPEEAQYNKAIAAEQDILEAGIEERKIIHNAEVRLRVNDIEGSCEKIKNRTIELKGYLQNYAVHTNENNASADIALKIPSVNYQTLLEFIVEQGKSDYKREYTDDVTTQYIDLDARVKVLKAEEESLLNILNKAEKIDDILKVKAQITSTRQERESLEGQLKALNSSIEYATINVNLYQPQNSDVNVNVENLNIFSQSGRALIYGFNFLTAGLGNIIVFFFTILPTLVLLGLIIFAFVYIKRRKSRKNNSE